MPYRRRKRRRRRRRRRAGLSRAAYRLAKKAYNSTDQELKFHDSTFDDVDIVSLQSTTVEQAFQLNIVGQGVGPSQRIGSSLKMRSSYLQIFIEKGAGNANITSEVRLALVYDREPNQVQPRANLLWQDPGVANTQVALGAPLSMNNKFRWRVLWEKRIILSDANSPVYWLKKFFPLKIMPVRYTGTAGNVGQTSTGGLWLFAISDITEGGAVPQISGTHRLKFVG